MLGRKVADRRTATSASVSPGTARVGSRRLDIQQEVVRTLEPKNRQSGWPRKACWVPWRGGRSGAQGCVLLVLQSCQAGPNTLTTNRDLDPKTPIDEWMTSAVFTIGDDQTMTAARERMHEHDVRHLPVLRGGHLRGIVSERDIALVESLPGVNPDELAISEVMTEEPYVVERGTPIRDVLKAMADAKYGAAVVVDGDRPVGIFTTIDAMRLAMKALGPGSSA